MTGIALNFKTLDLAEDDLKELHFVSLEIAPAKDESDDTGSCFVECNPEEADVWILYGRLSNGEVLALHDADTPLAAAEALARALAGTEDALEEAAKAIMLSGVYLEDGAPRTAAARLRKAAELIDQVAAQREAVLEELVQTTYPVPTEPGHYWAKLVDTSDFQAVCVSENYGPGPDAVRVDVPGMELPQLTCDFVWGPRIPDFNAGGRS